MQNMNANGQKGWESASKSIWRTRRHSKHSLPRIDRYLCIFIDVNPGHETVTHTKLLYRCFAREAEPSLIAEGAISGKHS